MIDNDAEYPAEYTEIAPITLPLAAGSVTKGVWCTTCLLPSRYEATVYVLADDGPRPIGVIDRCDGCSA